MSKIASIDNNADVKNKKAEGSDFEKQIDQIFYMMNEFNLNPPQNRLYLESIDSFLFLIIFHLF